MQNREQSLVVGYKHGYMRLLEHDKHSSESSSTNFNDFVKMSLLDDPTLEINQICD